MIGTRQSGLGIRRAILMTALLVGASSIGAQSAPSTDVYVYRFARPQDGVVNITKRAGYDNQPAYVGADLYYTAQVGSQTDIYRVNPVTTSVGPVVQTPESEYSVARTPDAKGYAVIRVELDSAQRLWHFPFDGGAPSVVLAGIKPVGYFAYLDSTTLALFVLGTPNTLQVADTRTGKGAVVTTNIGRSLQRVPGGRRASFTQRMGGRTTLLAVDPAPRADGSFAIDTVSVLPDSAEYVVWRDSATVITGAGSRLMQMQLPSKEWTVLADLSAQGIRRISRLALSPRGDTIAFVADEPR